MTLQSRKGTAKLLKSIITTIILVSIIVIVAMTPITKIFSSIVSVVMGFHGDDPNAIDCREDLECRDYNTEKLCLDDPCNLKSMGPTCFPRYEYNDESNKFDKFTDCEACANPCTEPKSTYYHNEDMREDNPCDCP